MKYLVKTTDSCGAILTAYIHDTLEAALDVFVDDVSRFDETVFCEVYEHWTNGYRVAQSTGKKVSVNNAR